MTAPPNEPSRRILPSEDSAAWPFVLPMAVFLALVFAGGLDERLHAWAYVARTLVVAGLLIWLWPRLRRDVAWTHLPLGALVGIVGVVQWVGMDKLLQWIRGRFPDNWILDGVWSLLISGVGPGDESVFDPVERILGPSGLAAFIAFVAIRTLGPVLVVPVMEELFWRNWLWRYLIAPNNWRLASVGEWDRTAVVGTCLAFALVHPQRLVSLVWAGLIAWLLLRTKSLGACIVAHAVTNLLLAAYVLIMALALGHAGEWYFW